jgi:hypothetical protein
MGPPRFRGALAVALLATTVAPAPAADRLERFRTVARERLVVAADAAERARAVAELYELVDAEVLDSLRADEPFASPAFLRERLDALTEAWGGATLRLLRVPGAGGRAVLTLGLYSLAGVEGAGSLRAYVGTGPGAALAASSTHDGLLDAQVWPVGPDRVVRVLALWSGAPAAHGARSLRAELWEQRAPDRVERAWSTAAQWPDGLAVSDWRTRPGELIVRYEPPYPGWKPGCPAQLEHEDQYRLAAGGGLVLARRRVVNGWRRGLGEAADRLFRALADGDAAAVARLVPAPALRARLPRGLGPEPVCEQVGPAGPDGPVTMAATELRDGRRAPWGLTWRRGPAGWRLQAAAPVLE